jgi:hypothetical protein
MLGAKTAPSGGIALCAQWHSMREKILVPVRDIRLTLKTPNPWATKCFSKRYGGAEKKQELPPRDRVFGCSIPFFAPLLNQSPYQRASGSPLRVRFDCAPPINSDTEESAVPTVQLSCRTSLRPAQQRYPSRAKQPESASSFCSRRPRSSLSPPSPKVE